MNSLILAAESGLNLTETFQTALQSIASDFNSMAGVAIPIALGIFAVMMVVPLGMKLFRRVVG